MRWTANKLRNLLMESNYKLPKGYSVLKRSRSLNGDMSLSFLSGDAGINPVKAFEARAYAKDSARKLRQAIKIQKEDMEMGLLGLDEISGKKERQERRQAKRDAKRGGSPAPSMPESEGDSGEGLEPSTPTTGGGGGRRAMRQERRATRKANRAIRKGGGGFKELVRRGAGLAPGAPLSPEAEAQAESAEQSAMQAGRSASEGTAGGGMFRGRNLLIIGGVALLDIGGIYFLTKKK